MALGIQQKDYQVAYEHNLQMQKNYYKYCDHPSLFSTIDFRSETDTFILDHILQTSKPPTPFSHPRRL